MSSGAGGVVVYSDGGENSSAYSGVYAGKMTILMKGDTIASRSITKEATVIIGSDGTGTLIADGDRVEGTLNGSEFGFSIRIVDVKDFVECRGDVLITGRFTGNIGDGSLSGSGECEVLSLDETISISGSLLVSK